MGEAHIAALCRKRLLDETSIARRRVALPVVGTAGRGWKEPGERDASLAENLRKLRNSSLHRASLLSGLPRASERAAPGFPTTILICGFLASGGSSCASCAIRGRVDFGFDAIGEDRHLLFVNKRGGSYGGFVEGCGVLEEQLLGYPSCSSASGDGQ